MVAALEASIRLNLPVMVHCEDPALIGGSMHEGEVSKRLGIRGIPAEAEESYLARDIELAERTGGWLYALHVSTAKGAAMIRDAKQRGVHVTGEVMPLQIGVKVSMRLSGADRSSVGVPDRDSRRSRPSLEVRPIRL